ncbi:putative endonuclease [Clostridiales Family XIII bacterium PM5-7]
MMKNRKALGDMGEHFAAAMLFDEGYSILETKYVCPMGEIDIIAAKENELHFVEVKTRQTDTFGRPAESVTREKQRRMKAAAKHYLQYKSVEHQYVSFQIFEIYINQIEHAF